MDATKRRNVKVARGYVGGTGRQRVEQQQQQRVGQEASDRSEHWLGIATVAIAFRPADQLPECELR